ncbi:MAG: YbaK/EbsC family protein [Chloroflexi bacterium]|nr:YbaK/EbsC family protein [Chloroflexota bacterium]MQC26633.1 YbaK/EbsC family protein [Chloroflexota bacterium]
MREPVNPTAIQFQEEINARGIDTRVFEFDETTRTAQDAANAIGCEVGQIVKSLVFQGANSGKAILILISGANRVDVEQLGAEIGEALKKADADFVRAATGYAIGGVPPFGHASTSRPIVDEDLLKFDILWAAAGTPNAVFSVTTNELLRACGGSVKKIT